MIKKKKFLFLSFLIIFVTLLSGCKNRMAEKEPPNTPPSNNQADQQENNQSSDIKVHKSGLPITENKLELTMMAPNLGLTEWPDMPFFKDYESQTNIHFTFNTPPQSEFSTKFNLTFASGDLPDIIYGGGPNTLDAATEVSYGQQGLFIPLEDYLPEYAPNIHKLLEVNPDIRKSITTTDGHIYALPNINEGPTSQWIMGPMWYNGQWLDALNVDELPTTTDEFFELMVRFRDEDPNGNDKKDEIPISDVNFGGIRHWLMPAFGLKGWGIQVKDDIVSYTFAEEGFRGYLEFMHKLYQEKLIDQEIFSQSIEQKQAKGQDNRIGLFQDWFSYFTTGRTEQEAINDPMYAPLTSTYQKEPIMPIGPNIKRGSFAITKVNPSPEASLRWIDYFYSKEGFEYLYYGPEGAYWNWDDQKKNKIYSDTAKQQKNPEEYRGTITPAYGITVPAYSVPLDPIGEEQDQSFNNFIQKETEAKILKYGEIIFPPTYLTPDEQEEIADIVVDLETFVLENEALFIKGDKEINDDTWHEYIQALKEIGYPRLVEIHQNAYDRWKKI